MRLTLARTIRAFIALALTWTFPSLFSTALSAEALSAHALIMAIGDYPSPIPKLKGVPYDTVTATEIARKMGVPDRNIRTLKDGELTLAGMRKAFDELEARLGGDDQVFIYYSGHGGRQLLNEGGTERCAESLITADGLGFLDTELESRLQRLAKKSQKTIVFVDACHSGGVTTRAVSAVEAPYTAKSYTPAGQTCNKPTNVLTRSLLAAKSAGAGKGANNYVHVAAAKDSEISLDQPGKGGVASRAWLNCLGQAVTDRDGSGGLTAEEIRQCAQTQIDRQLQGVPGFLPHHVAVNGNAGMVLSYATKASIATNATAGTHVTPATSTTLSAPATPPAPTTPTTPTAQAATSATAAPAPSAQAASVPQASPLAALNDIYNSRDDRRLVTLTADKTRLKIGRDAMHFSLTSREGGYLYVLMVGSDGKTFDLLFPNQIDRSNQIEAGATVRLPRPSWELSAGGPAGKNTLLAVVTDNPRDFSAAGLAPSGPFSSVNALAAKDIQLVTATAPAADSADCGDATKKRTLAIKKKCSNGYGAALMVIEEVD